MDSQPDMFRTNPGSDSLFGVNKVEWSEGRKLSIFGADEADLKLFGGHDFVRST
jgi:hypothetical protein